MKQIVADCKRCEWHGINLPDKTRSCWRHMPQQWRVLSDSIDVLAKPIIGKDDGWPYGPNVDLRSRVEMTMWATSLGLRYFEPSSGHRRDAFMRGSGGQKIQEASWQDHVSVWKYQGTGRLACLVAHPYKAVGDDLASELDKVVSAAPLLRYEAREQGWYGTSTTMITIWRSDTVTNGLLLGRGQKEVSNG